MHLKALSMDDFQMWVGALQQHSEAKTMNLQTEQNLSFDGGQTDDMVERSTDSDMDQVQRKAESMVNSLAKEVAEMKDLIDTLRGRIDNKIQGRGL